MTVIGTRAAHAHRDVDTTTVFNEPSRHRIAASNRNTSMLHFAVAMTCQQLLGAPVHNHCRPPSTMTMNNMQTGDSRNDELTSKTNPRAATHEADASQPRWQRDSVLGRLVTECRIRNAQI